MRCLPGSKFGMGRRGAAGDVPSVTWAGMGRSAGVAARGRDAGCRGGGGIAGGGRGKSRVGVSGGRGVWKRAGDAGMAGGGVCIGEAEGYG